METEPRPANTVDELEAVKRQRDGLAAALDSMSSEGFDGTPTEMAACNIILAAHDRAVAVRVLRDLLGKMQAGLDYDELLNVASQYERGEREVPNA